ncbi:MAG: TlpA disulfide reductase family protein [Thermoanaerobaculia bacterium]|nr:TlpA disulfide reductase family protein [Thermoanaerobaculia bacterium]
MSPLRTGRRQGAALVATAGLMVGVLFLGCRSEPARLGAGSRLSFELPSLDGDRIGPSDHRGKVVILDFMATWCAPCKIQNEVLTALAEEYSPDRLQILIVDSGEPMERVRKHFRERPVHHPVLVDADAALADRLDVRGFPTLLMLNEEGEVVFTQEGLAPPKILREELEKLGLSPAGASDSG